MKNVTISITEKVAKFARVYSAKRQKSLSRLIGDYLEALMRNEDERLRAYERFTSRGPAFDSNGKRFSRDEIYDRDILLR